MKLQVYPSRIDCQLCGLHRSYRALFAKVQRNVAPLYSCCATLLLEFRGRRIHAQAIPLPSERGRFVGLGHASFDCTESRSTGLLHCIVSDRRAGRSLLVDTDSPLPTCRQVIEHMLLVEAADLKYPIILCPQGRVMDGMHRVAKALLLGNSEIAAVRLPELPSPDHVGVDPDDLCYDEI